MKTEHKPTYLIDPKDKGFVVDYLENGKPRQSAHSSRKLALSSIISKIPVNHQLLITDMGEVKRVKLDYLKVIDNEVK
jgi:hypothetical protein